LFSLAFLLDVVVLPRLWFVLVLARMYVAVVCGDVVVCRVTGVAVYGDVTVCVVVCIVAVRVVDYVYVGCDVGVQVFGCVGAVVAAVLL